METVVPGTLGDIDSAPVLKRAGVVCPQLVSASRDRYLCALYGHVQAGDSRLRDCANWSGEGNGFLQLAVSTEAWINRPPDSRAVEMIAHLTRAGILTGFGRHLDAQEGLEVARHYLCTIGTCPAEIFRLLGIDAAFRTMYNSESPAYFAFDRELWELSPDLYNQFFRECVWKGVGPYARRGRRTESIGP